MAWNPHFTSSTLTHTGVSVCLQIHWITRWFVLRAFKVYINANTLSGGGSLRAFLSKIICHFSTMPSKINNCNRYFWPYFFKKKVISTFLLLFLSSFFLLLSLPLLLSVKRNTDVSKTFKRGDKHPYDFCNNIGVAAPNSS